MIKIGEKTFFLTDTEGNEVPWSVTDLQSELIYCFVSTGVAQNSCFAEDVIKGYAHPDDCIFILKEHMLELKTKYEQLKEDVERSDSE